jgi:hypothetical protein
VAARRNGRPEEILADLDQPVALLVFAVLHFISDTSGSRPEVAPR